MLGYSFYFCTIIIKQWAIMEAEEILHTRPSPTPDQLLLPNPPSSPGPAGSPSSPGPIPALKPKENHPTKKPLDKNKFKRSSNSQDKVNPNCISRAAPSTVKPTPPAYLSMPPSMIVSRPSRGWGAYQRINSELKICWKLNPEITSMSSAEPAGRNNSENPEPTKRDRSTIYTGRTKPTSTSKQIWKWTKMSAGWPSRMSNWKKR